MLFLSETGAMVTGSCVDTKGLLALIAATVPDAVVVDWRLEGNEVANVIERLRTIHKPLRIVVLGSRSEDESAVINAGADAYVVVGDRPEGLASVLGVLLPSERHEREPRR